MIRKWSIGKRAKEARYRVTLDALLEEANIARDASRWSHAVESYERYLATRPDHSEVRVQLGHCLKENGQPDKAVAAYRSAIVDEPENHEIRLHLAHVLKNQGHLADAVAEFETLLGVDAFTESAAFELRRAIPEKYQLLGDRCRDRGDWAGAAEAYSECLRLSPELASIWVQLGHARKELHQFDDAVAAYREAVARDPSSADAWSHLGHALRLTGPRNDCVSSLARAWVQGMRDPETVTTLSNIAGYSWNEIRDAITTQAREAGIDPSDVKHDLETCFGALAFVQSAHKQSDEGLFGIVYLSGIDWGYRRQRPQHMSRAFADAGHSVRYVSTAFDQNADRPGYINLGNRLERVVECRLQIPGSGPGTLHMDISNDSYAAAAAALQSLCDDFQVNGIIVIVDHPAWTPICRQLRKVTLVYDCIDNIAAFPGISKTVVEAERELLELADVVVASSQPLVKRLPSRTQAILIPNGVEASHFIPVSSSSPPENQIRIVYFGLIADWFAWEWIEAAAKARPDWCFQLIGEVVSKSIEPLKTLRNVEFTGEVPYAALPDFLQKAHAAIVPFRIDQLTQAVNPLKCYEYLAAGRPVVSSALPEVAAIPWVTIAADAQQFVAAIESAIETDSPELRKRRASWAADHDWSVRAGLLLDLLRENNAADQFACLAGQTSPGTTIRDVPSMNVPFRDFVLFVAPFPKPGTVVEGWMGRIRAVDEIFATTPRIYLHFSHSANAAEPPRRIRHESNAIELFVHPTSASHNAIVADLMAACRLCYVQTVHLAKYVIGYVPTGKIVTDFHGIVPEEEEMMGNPEAGRFYEGVECTVVHSSRYIVVVTEAMARHLRAKYPEARFDCIVLPIIVDYAEKAARKSESDEVVIIYSGGSQIWQNIDLMLHKIAESNVRAKYKIASHDKSLIESKAKSHHLREQIEFGVYSRDELPAFYSSADFGFVLRDDTPVNRVACPTKLTEYLEFGIIPIVKLVEIGDFSDEGYEFITDEEFGAGLVPGRAQRLRMIEKNRRVLKRLRDLFSTSAQNLLAMRLESRIPSGEFSGLPTSSLVGLMPWKREVYIFGAKTHYVSALFSRPYETARFNCGEDTSGDLVRIVPMVGDFCAKIEKIEIELDSAAPVHPIVVQSQARPTPKGDHFSVEAPFFELKLSSISRVRAVEVSLSFLEVGPETWKAAPVAARDGDASVLTIVIRRGDLAEKHCIAPKYLG